MFQRRDEFDAQLRVLRSLLNVQLLVAEEFAQRIGEVPNDLRQSCDDLLKATRALERAMRQLADWADGRYDPESGGR